MNGAPEQTALIDSEPTVDAALESTAAARGHDPDAIVAGLNPQQRAAVTHLGGPLLIVAGAGSGKTRTLTRRFEWLASQGVPVDRILALTYTNDAAAELAERIELTLGESVDDANATTFHSLCLNLLRDEHVAAGLNPFLATATDPDRIAIILSRLNELSFSRLELRGNPAAIIGDLLNLINRLKEDCVGPEDLLRYAESTLADAVDPDDRAKAELLVEQAQFYAMHDVFLREANVLDFGGLQFELWKLLSKNEDVRRRIARRYDHILVDEFQDTSYAQLEILRLLAADHGNIAAVGDDDQSIYRFRGANARSITDFGARFGGHTRIELELNYRSAPAIIDAARTVVGAIDSDRRVPKNLRADESNISGGVRFWHCASEIAEAQAVVAEIERLIADEAVEPREISILAQTRKNVEVIADRLAVHEIPHVLVTKDFFHRSEIRVPLAWLKVLSNPTLNEDAWRMLTAPPISLDSSEYAALMRWMSKNKFPHVIAALRNAARAQFAPETRDKIRMFLAAYDAAAEALDELRPGEFVIRLINRVSLKGTLLLSGDDRTPDRLANLGKLQRMAEEFSSRRPQATAREFALYIMAMAESGSPETSEPAQSNPNAVRVMTAHGSKGLEFDYVFIPGMTRRRWPGSSKGDRFEMPAALEREHARKPPGDSESAIKRAEHVEETRRLLHVAMTRARKQLILSWFDSESRSHAVSDFFGEAMTAVPDAIEERFEERDFEAAEFVFAELAHLRGKVIGSIDEAGAQLGEMRLDASSDTPGDVARFTELVKLSALTHRLRQGQSVASALPEINDMLTTTMSPSQRTAYDSSPLDARLLEAEQRAERLERIVSEASPQLGSYLPVTKDGMLRLSASDLSVYQRCPKMYEFEKVLRIPTREQSHLRLGILVHNVLERFHRDTGDDTLEPEAARTKLRELTEQAVATGGWGTSDDDRQLLDRARAMLERYADSEFCRPSGKIELERKFQLKLEPSPAMAESTAGGRRLIGIQVNGKIDRIEHKPDGAIRLLDYKTGKKKSLGDIQKDAQLVIYRLAARESLGFEASELVYYYLEDQNPAVAAEATDDRVAEVRQTINDVADNIVRMNFTPAPEYSKCKTCAFSHVCPATEA